MKKGIFGILMLVAMVATMSVFTSCSKDDDLGGGHKPSVLVGTWENDGGSSMVFEKSGVYTYKTGTTTFTGNYEVVSSEPRKFGSVDGTKFVLTVTGISSGTRMEIGYLPKTSANREQIIIGGSAELFKK